MYPLTAVWKEFLRKLQLAWGDQQDVACILDPGRADLSMVRHLIEMLVVYRHFDDVRELVREYCGIFHDVPWAVVTLLDMWEWDGRNPQDLEAARQLLWYDYDDDPMAILRAGLSLCTASAQPSDIKDVYTRCMVADDLYEEGIESVRLTLSRLAWLLVVYGMGREADLLAHTCVPDLCSSIEGTIREALDSLFYE